MEWLLYHHEQLWVELKNSIEAVSAEACRTKVSKEKTMKGELKFSPGEMNKAIAAELKKRDWAEERYDYYVTDDEKLTRRIVSLAAEDQKREIQQAKKKLIKSYHQTDFVKNKIAVEVQFGKYAFIEFDLFVKHLGFYMRSNIDLGIEIVPSKVLQNDMSSGPGYYERTLNHILRQGRGSPSVPFILIGIEP